MPTIKDIAKEAGVSHGTVSNVINGRDNVSAEKMRLVWQAAEKLGYKVNTDARTLRHGGLSRTVAVILPSIEERRFAAMYEVFQQELGRQDYAVQLYSTRSMQAAEQALLTRAMNGRPCAVIASSCLPDAVEHYRTETDGVPLVFLQQAGPEQPDVMYAGFDMEQAGRDIARHLRTGGARQAAVFTDMEDMPDTARFLRGFRQGWPRSGGTVRYFACPDHQAELRAFELFDADADYDFIVCSDRRREKAVRAACAYASRRPLPRLVTVATQSALTGPAAPVYELDYKGLAHRLVKALLRRLERGVPLPGTLRMENTGFHTQPPAPLRKDMLLRMLTIASPSTAALSRLLPFLEKSAGIRLELTVLPSLRDVYDLLQTSSRSRYDLIRMDVAWMDELAESLFRPLDQIPFDWDKLLARTIPELRENYTSIHGRRYCVPYDPSTQLMFYRLDLFNDPTYRRMFFEQFRTNLTVPETFADYNRVARFFTRSHNPASPVQYGTAVAVGNVVVSPGEFLPRLFEEGGNLLDGEGRITVDTPEALRALRNYQETYAYSDRSVYDFWKNVLEGFADGSAAMTVVFINYASHILNMKMSSIAGKLGFAPVPGGKPLLGGGVVGISRDCAKPEIASAFLSWLYSDEVAPVFTLLGGLSPCRSAYGSRDINERYPWLSTARKCFSTAQRRGNSSYYSNFSELHLESILAAHLQEAVLGVCTPEEGLRQAQAGCDAYFHR